MNTLRWVWVVVVVLVGEGVRAAEWPQWLGVARDGVYREEGIMSAWPKDGAKALWRVPVGQGYAGPAVAGGKVVLTSRIPAPKSEKASDPFKRGSLAGSERIVCLEVESGRELWRVEYDCPYTVSYASGPRATPLIEEERVYTLGAEGDLHCFALADGKVIWKKKLEGPTPTWGFAAHPLIDGEKLLVLGATKLLALDKKSGAEVWSVDLEGEGGYSPPTIRTILGKRQLIQWTPRGVLSVEPQSGARNWFVVHGPTKYGASIVAPLLIAPDMLVITSEFEGAAGVKVGDGGAAAQKVWEVKKKGRETSTIHCLMSPLVEVDGAVVGFHIDGQLRCIDPASGKIIWESIAHFPQGLGEEPKLHWYAGFLSPWQPAGEGKPRHWFLASESGELILCKLSREGYTELSRAKLLEPTNSDVRGRTVMWSPPAYAQGSVFWRNDKEMVRVSLRAN